MPAMPAATPREPGARGEDELVVTPFRGVRFDPTAVPDLAAVTSPPYDVVDADGARRLEALHPFNVVRLILPREDALGGAGRYEHAAATLREWLRAGVLRRDPEAAIYVYEQQRNGELQRGLLAAVGLRQPESHVVLPHEDVMPGPVHDRLELMRATEANLEPILLVYQDAPVTAALIAAAAQTPPVVEARTGDGVRHRLWAVTDASTHAAISRELAPRQALIADGHHRYATYLRLQAEKHEAGSGDGPWDFGLALLVDNGSYPLDLQSISRVVEGLACEAAVEMAQKVFGTTRRCASLEEGQRLLAAAAGRHAFLLADGSTFAVVSDPDVDLLTAALASAPEAHHPLLDATVLHSFLLDHLWRVSDASGRIRYLHQVENALREAARTAGTAVFMRPVAMSAVVAAAARGERMPRKSTSFGPKPRTGFVLRLLEE